MSRDRRCVVKCRSATLMQMDEVQKLQAAMRCMYSQEHVDKLEREVQKANLLLIKVQSKWQQAQLASGGGVSGAVASGEGRGLGPSTTPRPDWDEFHEKFSMLQVLQLPRKWRACSARACAVCSRAAAALTTFPADTPKRALVAAGDMQRAARVLT